MNNLVVVGCQWGDEGKGKLVDYLGDKADIIAVSYTHLTLPTIYSV